MLVQNNIVPVQNFSLIRMRTMVPQYYLFTNGDTGAPMDLTGFLFQMDVVDCDGNVLTSYSVGDGFSVPAETPGILLMTKESNEKNIPAGVYGHELKVTAPNGFVGTWWRGQYISIEVITE